ncbi:NAD(P)-dependent oxidoreductase [Synechococcus sp. RSCCF101]|uniref:NAD(P)-dependent oxidoreductase n=1 Tax=Synechococcus sp. RSCCF101 TaxID=2511069 RepID=UPI001248BB85|nr:NAD(P)-dependent oxidoreductase [Synechococcus sp. RSCCF101]QEY32816.1 NAD(P)-dependent oxidoreductase [Synechococcus sp. RSCCF101]
MTGSDRLPLAGFIGLGALGAPMAQRWLQAGVSLWVHNRSRERERPLAVAGARRAANPAELAAGCRLVGLCLSDDAAVETVLQQARPALQTGSLVIDFSTIAPATSRRMAASLEPLGVHYIDAPVTGGTEGAAAGTLSVLVGGRAEDLERARPLLEIVGGRISHLGPVGAGQEAKAVNQVLVAGSYAAVAEAMALGERLGLPMEQVIAALSSGAAGSWALDHRAKGMLARRFPLGFRLTLHHKDLGIALAAAGDLPLPVTRLVARLEAELIAAGHGDEDVSALMRGIGGDGPERGGDGSDQSSSRSR